MPLVANNVCSYMAVSVFHCMHKDKYADVMWVEKSIKQLANNYLAEIVGGCCAQLIMKAVISGKMQNVMVMG